MKKLKQSRLCVGKTSIQSCNLNDKACTKCEYGNGHQTVKLLSALELVELFGRSVLYLTDLENVIKMLSDFREHASLSNFEKDELSAQINRISAIVKDMNRDGSIISCNLYFKYRVDSDAEAVEQQSPGQSRNVISRLASSADIIQKIMSLSTTALEVIRMLELDDQNAEIALDRLIEEIASVTGRKLLKG